MSLPNSHPFLPRVCNVLFSVRCERYVRSDERLVRCDIINLTGQLITDNRWQLLQLVSKQVRSPSDVELWGFLLDFIGSLHSLLCDAGLNSTILTWFSCLRLCQTVSKRNHNADASKPFEPFWRNRLPFKLNSKFAVLVWNSFKWHLVFTSYLFLFFPFFFFFFLLRRFEVTLPSHEYLALFYSLTSAVGNHSAATQIPSTFLFTYLSGWKSL